MIDKAKKKQIRKMISNELLKENIDYRKVRELYKELNVGYWDETEASRKVKETKAETKKLRFVPVDLTIEQYFDLHNYGFIDAEIAKLVGVNRPKLYRWKKEKNLIHGFVQFDVEEYKQLRRMKMTLDEIAEYYGFTCRTSMYAYRKKYGLVDDCKRGVKRRS